MGRDGASPTSAGRTWQSSGQPACCQLQLPCACPVTICTHKPNCAGAGAGAPFLVACRRANGSSISPPVPPCARHAFSAWGNLTQRFGMQLGNHAQERPQASGAAAASLLLLLLCVLVAAAGVAIQAWRRQRCTAGRQHTYLWQCGLEHPGSLQSQQQQWQPPWQPQVPGSGLLAGMGIARRDRLEHLLNSELGWPWPGSGSGSGSGSRHSSNNNVEMPPAPDVLAHELMKAGAGWQRLTPVDSSTGAAGPVSPWVQTPCPPAQGRSQD